MQTLIRIVPLLAVILVNGCSARRVDSSAVGRAAGGSGERHVLPVDPAASHSIPEFIVPPAQAGRAYERIMVIGDMGTGRADQHKVAAAMVKRARSDGLDFILTLGDNFYPDGVQSVDDPQWTHKFEDVYADPALQVPVYASLGNHDHRGSIQAQVDYTRRSSRWTMPDTYYTFTRTLRPPRGVPPAAGADATERRGTDATAEETKVQFFAIDTTPIVTASPSADAQLRWLDEQLSRSDARWKIVFGHHPVYSHSWHGDEKIMIERVEPLLNKHRVDLYLAGHDHALELIKPSAKGGGPYGAVNGVHYVISGAAGGPDKAYKIDWSDESYYAATLGGYVLLRTGKDELVIEFVRLDGRTQYAYTLRK